MTSTVQSPGSPGGPCYADCEHDQCEMLRVIASRQCPVCLEVIGYGREYTLNADHERVHVECQKPIEEAAKQL